MMLIMGLPFHIGATELAAGAAAGIPAATALATGATVWALAGFKWL